MVEGINRMALGVLAAPAVYARTKDELRGATIAALRISAERDPLLDAWLGTP